jgi:hypothetical protein
MTSKAPGRQPRTAIADRPGIWLTPYQGERERVAERFIRTLLAGWAYGAIYRWIVETYAESLSGDETAVRPCRDDRVPEPGAHMGDAVGQAVFTDEL